MHCNNKGKMIKLLIKLFDWKFLLNLSSSFTTCNENALMVFFCVDLF